MKGIDVFRIYAFHALLAICLTLAATYCYFLIFGVPPGSIGQTAIIFVAIVIGVVRPIGIVNDRKRPDHTGGEQKERADKAAEKGPE